MYRRLAVALIWAAAAAGADSARVLSALSWTDPRGGFGGFSAIEVSADGRSFVALSDRGRIGRGEIRREHGRIVSVRLTDLRRLRDEEGAPLTADGMKPGREADAEALARDQGGQVFIAFEGMHRVGRLSKNGDRVRVLPGHAAFALLPSNSGLEALAIDRDGRLYAIAEDPGAHGFDVFRRDADQWHVAFSLPARDGFAVTGADFGPDGRLYLLERRFSLLTGFIARIRRFEITDEGPRAEATLYWSAPFARDNLEGISIWQSARGLRAIVVSDDNFQRLQRTELVELALPE